MKVHELIKALTELHSPDAEVRHLWDGELRTAIENVYIGKTGICVTADKFEVAYSNEGRPGDAPDQKIYWETPGDEDSSPY